MGNFGIKSILKRLSFQIRYKYYNPVNITHLHAKCSDILCKIWYLLSLYTCDFGYFAFQVHFPNFFVNLVNVIFIDLEIVADIVYEFIKSF